MLKTNSNLILEGVNQFDNFRHNLLCRVVGKRSLTQPFSVRARIDAYPFVQRRCSIETPH